MKTKMKEDKILIFGSCPECKKTKKNLDFLLYQYLAPECKDCLKIEKVIEDLDTSLKT